jgi:3-hydroxyisobutyrate dehydrogenase
MTASPRVAFLGLGAIGTPMAEHVARQYSLTVWNRTRAVADEFAKRTGAAVAETAADAARGADIVITCLPSSIEVEQVLFMTNGVAESIVSGAVLIDCTSGDPTASRRIAERLQLQHVRFLDAPVSGGVVGAQAGNLTVMCGGDAATLDHVRPILQTFGEKIVLAGPVGCGHALKAVNNALLAVHIWSTAEGLAMLQKLGVDPALALDVINASSGRSNASMNLFPERVLTRAFPRTFRLALLDKDIGIAASMAKETRTDATLIEHAAKLFAEAHRELGPEADHVEAVKVVERRAGLPAPAILDQS